MGDQMMAIQFKAINVKGTASSAFRAGEKKLRPHPKNFSAPLGPASALAYAHGSPAVWNCFAMS